MLMWSDERWTVGAECHTLQVTVTPFDRGAPQLMRNVAAPTAPAQQQPPSLMLPAQGYSAALPVVAALLPQAPAALYPHPDLDRSTA